MGINRKIESQEYKGIIVCLGGLRGCEKRKKTPSNLIAGGFKAKEMLNLTASIICLIETIFKLAPAK